ncbi:hypothetical protein FB45DRAFT_1131370 [Roridomyces roridus]|uniref:F-box domain-containing protein n=1 Tax=Roridomyces roridus TaxID=1738132 RepID=A0AAD7B1Z8_9AGAR|nr:hypothetical protein FB45DRAFT_1131370 [Roridomyces roridus]
MDTSNSLGHLPAELLQLIFTFFIESYDPFAEIDAILLLSHVCSRWHAICDSTPLLWTRPYFHRCKSPSLNHEIVSTILSRSGDLPVSVTIDMMSSPGHAPEAVLDYQPLFGAKDRLENLVLAVRRGDVVQCAAKIPTFPLLASLDITMADESPAELQLLGDIFLSSCPSLRAFSLTVRHAVIPPRIPALPFHQLTSLTLLCRVQDVTLYDILIQCPLLEECRVEEVEETGELPQGPVHIMPALRSLDYTAADECLGDIFRRLRLPFLDSLALSSLPPGRTISWNPVPIILDLHAGAPFQLLHLRINGLDITSEELLPLLRCVAPTLQTLVVVDMPHVLPSFAAADLTLPRLATLEIRCHSDQVDEAQLVQLVDSFRERLGESNTLFPALRLVELQMDGPLFDEAAEEETYGIFRDVEDWSEGVEGEEIDEWVIVLPSL